MCTGKCSICLAVSLYPLAVVSIVCNIALFFPNVEGQYVRDGHITSEVYYMGGLVGGGLMVFVCALYIHTTGARGCCANRCGMFLSIAFAAMGVAGSLYSFLVALMAMMNGPLCYTNGTWTTPYVDGDGSYISDPMQWKKCHGPPNIVSFNIGLFGTLVALSGTEIVLCSIQAVNGLIGCICGTCVNKDTL